MTAHYNVYCDHHRFNYMLQGVPREWTHYRQGSPASKTALFENATTQIFIECHDGVVDDGPMESTGRLEIVIRAANKNKRTFYIKPNWSDTMSAHFKPLAEAHHVTLGTCMPWSYYNPYQVILKERDDLRLHRTIRTKDLFAGSLWKPERKVWLDSVSADYDILSTATAGKLISAMLACQRTLQPLGCGPRHNIYESLALGVEFVFEPNSFMKPSIAAVAQDPQAQLDLFETQMLPHQIVSQIMSVADESCNPL